MADIANVDRQVVILLPNQRHVKKHKTQRILPVQSKTNV